MIETVKEWLSDQCLRLGATISYYAFFSLFPLVLIMFSIIGFLVDPEELALTEVINNLSRQFISSDLVPELNAEEEFFTLIRENVSGQVADLIESTLLQLRQSRGGLGIIGFITLLLSASGAFDALNYAFNVIWGIEGPKRGSAQNSGITSAAITFAGKKLLSFGMVFGCAILLLLSMISGVVITFFSTYTAGLPGGELLWQSVRFLITIGLFTLVLMLLFKFLPQVHIAWGDVWIAALFTALATNLLLIGVSYYISRGSFQVYGTIGTVMALLVWIYFTSVLLLFGGELSQVYAHMFGSFRGQPLPGTAPPQESVPPTTDVSPDQKASSDDTPTYATDLDVLKAGIIGAVAGIVAIIVVSIGSVVIGISRIKQWLQRK